MPSFKKLVEVVLFGLVAVTTVEALPALPRISERGRARYDLARRQATAAAASGITDIDILQLLVYTFPFSSPFPLPIFPTAN